MNNKQTNMESGRKRGRPRVLTDADRKRKKRELQRFTSRTKVYLGDQYERWQRLKKERDETNRGLAKVLLDNWFVHLHQWQCCEHGEFFL